MCGRIIQSGGPLRYVVVDGMNVRDRRVHDYSPRWNGAPSQELLVIRRNHKTGEVFARPAPLGPHPELVCRPDGRPQADQRQVLDGARPSDLPRRVSRARSGGRLPKAEHQR
jgi:hypothetical protein